MTLALGIPLAIIAVALAGAIGYALHRDHARRKRRPDRRLLREIAALKADWRLKYATDFPQWETELREETTP